MVNLAPAVGEPLVLGSGRLSLEGLVAVARDRRQVAPLSADPASLERVRTSARWVRERAGALLGENDGGPMPVYGVNTGFGSLAGRAAFDGADSASDLSRRLVISTSFGYGEYLDEETVRAAMLIRANSLAQGHSGVRPELIDLLVDCLNKGVCPAVPAMGSLGASGDLIPLAHVALAITRQPGDHERDADSGEAFVWDDDGPDGPRRRMASGRAAMARAGIERLVLGPKEGLAFTNGTAFSAALTALALERAERVMRTADVAVAATAEAVHGFRDAFLPDIHEARGHQGQIDSAHNVLACLEGSELVSGDADADPDRHPPQDAYSIRCAPQVHGAVRDTLAFVRSVVETELNAATDNPLVFPTLPESRALKAVSGGNFHAEYLAFASDFLSISITEVAGLAERRLFRLNDSSLSRGLPDMLVRSDIVGLDCGYMLGQYLAAALVSRCKTLCHPDSVDSIPTCANQEDHVSMAMNAGLHALQVAEMAEAVVAIEVLMSTQALDLRLGSKANGSGVDAYATLGRGGRLLRRLVRAQTTAEGDPVEYLDRDRVMYPYFRSILELVRGGTLLDQLREEGVDLR